MVVDGRSRDAGLAGDRAQGETVRVVVDQAEGGLDDLHAQPASLASRVSPPRPRRSHHGSHDKRLPPVGGKAAPPNHVKLAEL